MKRVALMVIILLGWEIAAIAADSKTSQPVRQIGRSDAPVVIRSPKTSEAKATVAPASQAPRVRPAVADPNKPIPAAFPAPRTPVRKAATRDQTLLAFNRQLMNVDYQELDLEAVLNDWRQRVGVNLVVYWPAIEAAGVNRDDPVTLRLENVSPQRVLGYILKQVSSGGRGPISYRIESDGVVEIDVATPWDPYDVRVYYIADLIETPGGGY